MKLEAYSLAGDWRLWEASLAEGPSQYGSVVGAAGGWIPAIVPGDIHMDLIRAGKMPEPLIGTNSMECVWIEERSWWYDRDFDTLSEWSDADVVELELDGLDFGADIWLNETHLGCHMSAFRPFIADVKSLLRSDGKTNRLVVRLTTGNDRFSKADIAPMANFFGEAPGLDNRGDKRRIMMRKAQYSFGWDWNPRVPTCGLTGTALIRPMKSVVLRDVSASTTLNGSQAAVNVTVAVETLDWIGTTEAVVTAELVGPEGSKYSIRQDMSTFLLSGYNELKFVFRVDDAKLWWPNGMGEQPLYRLTAWVEAEGVRSESEPKLIGLRTVDIDQTPLAPGQRLFAIVVNGVKTYCKGADWIPADSIYARVSGEKYEALVVEAKDANFNMLRIWGGGIYEPDIFFEMCDKHGIMLWHDFMFACAPYPDHLEWFRDEVKKEVEHQVVRLRNHPSIVLWCGNNENHWAFADWWQSRAKGGAIVYNNIIPRVLADKCPSIPYWNSSPYGGKSPNCAEYGDRHHWGDCMMNSEMIKRITPEEYDLVDPKFVSEYGYVGPCGLETTLQYLAGEPMDRTGKAWQHHNNTFEKDTVVAGIKKHYADPDGLSVEDYLLYAGLCQGMMYEYSLDSFRSKPNCHGGLFWMYNDCWGEVGWTIVDYYCRRKISYNFVRRADAHKRVIIRKVQGTVQVTLANDTPDVVSGILEYGYMSFDGTNSQLMTTTASVEPFTRKVVAEFGAEGFDLISGCVMARMPEVEALQPGIMRSGDFRTLSMSSPKLNVQLESNSAFTVSSDVFAHAVHFSLPDGAKASDCYFDLLPGETRRVVVDGVTALTVDELAVRSVLPS